MHAHISDKVNPTLRSVNQISWACQSSRWPWIALEGAQDRTWVLREVRIGLDVERYKEQVYTWIPMLRIVSSSHGSSGRRQLVARSRIGREAKYPVPVTSLDDIIARGAHRSSDHQAKRSTTTPLGAHDSQRPPYSSSPSHTSFLRRWINPTNNVICLYERSDRQIGSSIELHPVRPLCDLKETKNGIDIGIRIPCFGWFPEQVKLNKLNRPVTHFFILRTEARGKPMSRILIKCMYSMYCKRVVISSKEICRQFYKTWYQIPTSMTQTFLCEKIGFIGVW